MQENEPRYKTEGENGLFPSGPRKPERSREVIGRSELLAEKR